MERARRRRSRRRRRKERNKRRGNVGNKDTSRGGSGLRGTGIGIEKGQRRKEDKRIEKERG